jgi:hypothetical protein
MSKRKGHGHSSAVDPVIAAGQLGKLITDKFNDIWHAQSDVFCAEKVVEFRNEFRKVCIEHLVCSSSKAV